MKKLNCREIELIKFMAKGLTAKEIARVTGLEPRTVETYMQNARKKLKAKNTAHAVFIAFKENILNEAS